MKRMYAMIMTTNPTWIILKIVILLGVGLLVGRLRLAHCHRLQGDNMPDDVHNQMEQDMNEKLLHLVDNNAELVDKMLVYFDTLPSSIKSRESAHSFARMSDNSLNATTTLHPPDYNWIKPVVNYLINDRLEAQLNPEFKCDCSKRQPQSTRLTCCRSCCSRCDMTWITDNCYACKHSPGNDTKRTTNRTSNTIRTRSSFDIDNDEGDDSRASIKSSDYRDKDDDEANSDSNADNGDGGDNKRAFDNNEYSRNKRTNRYKRDRSEPDDNEAEQETDDSISELNLLPAARMLITSTYASNSSDSEGDQVGFKIPKVHHFIGMIENLPQELINDNYLLLIEILASFGEPISAYHVQNLARQQQRQHASEIAPKSSTGQQLLHRSADETQNLPLNRSITNNEGLLLVISHLLKRVDERKSKCPVCPQATPICRVSATACPTGGCLNAGTVRCSACRQYCPNFGLASPCRNGSMTGSEPMRSDLGASLSSGVSANSTQSANDEKPQPAPVTPTTRRPVASNNSFRADSAGAASANQYENDYGDGELDAEFRQLLAAARKNQKLDSGNSTSESAASDCRGATCEFRSKCGLAPLNNLNSGKRFASYMINGQRQLYGEWPSFARLVFRWNQWGLESTCGGTVVSDRHILTAAHCMFNPINTSHSAEVANINVVLGEDRIDFRDEHERVYGVSSACVSRKFTELTLSLAGADAENTRYDFAVLTLKDKIEFNEHYQPACLPYDRLTTTNTKQTKCFLVGTGVVGYDRNGATIMSKTVEKMRMRQMSCEPYGFGYRDSSRECYTKADAVGDSCGGDSGGPILCLEPRAKRWTVVGTVSYGSAKCNGEGHMGWTGAYARITTLLPLIKAECSI